MPAAKKKSDTDDELAWSSMVAFFKKKGCRITPVRRKVFSAVMSRHDHFRVDELAAELVKEPTRVSRATVYSTLALMVEAGFVRPIRDADLHCHYEHVYGHSQHEHMICDTCGSFIEFTAPEVLKMVDKHCRKLGFERRAHLISIFGTCQACCKKRAGRAGLRG